MEKQEIDNRINRYLKGDLNKKELVAFLKDLQTDEGMCLLQASMDEKDFLESSENEKQLSSSEYDKLYHLINKQINKKRIRDLHFYKAAATIVLLVGLFFGIFGSLFHLHFKHQNNLSWVEYTAKDSLRNITLPDGTHVCLNAHSKLSFEKNFNDLNKRNVWLSGEAFFEVSKNPEKPFIIDIDNAFITVLGTKFNVKSRDINKKLVAVKEGKVAFQKKHSFKKLYLTANEIGVLDEQNQLKKVSQPVQNYFSWFNEYLEFDNTSIATVIQQLKDIYNVDIIVQNKEIEEISFTAYMHTAPIDKILNQLAYSLELNLYKQNNIYYLSK